MMSPEDAKRYLDFLENGSREGLTSAELTGVEKADALLVSRKVEYEDVWDLRNAGDVLASGKYFDGTIESGSYIARAELTGDTYFSLGTQWNDITQAYGLSDKEMFNLFNTRALDDAVMQGKKWETKWINFVFLM